MNTIIINKDKRSKALIAIVLLYDDTIISEFFFVLFL